MNGLWALAERQYGIFTRAQAREFGYTNRQVDAWLRGGRIERVHAGVFRVVGSSRTARQRAMAACFFAGRGSRLSHQTAGALLRLDGVRSRELHLTVLHSVRRRPVARIQLHRTVEMTKLDCVMVDELPTTSATRTILDLASVLDTEQLEVAFESARRRRLTSSDAIARRFERFGGQGRAGSGRIRDLLAASGERPAESPLEVKAHRLLRRNGLRPVLQLWITGADQRRFRIDFAWPDRRIAVECDGFEWHGDRLAWKRDRRRIASIEAANWRVIHLTWEDVTRHPAETIQRILSAVEAAAA